MTADEPDVVSGWQGKLCQFFTRDEIARYCLGQLSFPPTLLNMRLLEPAAGRGAFILPLIERLAKTGSAKRNTHEQLHEMIRAYEVDKHVADRLRANCKSALEVAGFEPKTATSLVKAWVVRGDFLDADLSPRFTHIVGNPPYIRWDAIPRPLLKQYRAQFGSFRARADLYVAFIEKSLGLLDDNGQLAFLCPINWTRNSYGKSVREALTARGWLKTIIDFTNVDSFERPADAYPSFFVYSATGAGDTEIVSIANGKGGLESRGRPIRRTFAQTTSPFILASKSIGQFVERAKRKFPKLEEAGCIVRVGSATGCNDVFLGAKDALPVERSRLLRFVNAGSIHEGRVRWSETHVVNVFDRNSKLVDLDDYPRLRSYLLNHKARLRGRAKANQSACWWRTIDVLHKDWYGSQKLLVSDIASAPVIGLDTVGYCAGGGVYQIKSQKWPLEDLQLLLSAGVLGTFVGALSHRSTHGFQRFQKKLIVEVPIPHWDALTPDWRASFRAARLKKDVDLVLALVADLYGCSVGLLAAHTARDWKTFGARSERVGVANGPKAVDRKRKIGRRE